MTPAGGRPGLFEAFGVEIETMIVDAGTLDVKPVCDRLLEAVAGEPAAEVELGDVAWSNELTLHVLELKTNGPAPSLQGLAGRFHESVSRAAGEAAKLGARLMPGAMHPWMDPHAETRIWPHEYTEVYHAFDRIFGCAGHGWSNLQSTHVNLPFADDAEFALLHAAVRLVLPLVPALAAASPFQDGRRSAALDGRLVAYRENARRVPSVTGSVVPEPVSSREQYEREILGRIYADLAPHDPEGVLRHEWVNARGAIARFDRGTIEIRVIDAQECPTADLAVVAAVAGVVRSLAIGRLSGRRVERDPATEALAHLLEAAAREGDLAVVDDRAFLLALGAPDRPTTLRDLWARLLDAEPPDDPEREWTRALQIILDEGPLARRMLRCAGAEPGRRELERVARALCDCLATNQPLRAGA
ncbi:MAG TPA: glutamate-cysteine ligase family protein [Longimicrobiales bacterium]|nr:glutamate-cysteine ligase family protein [Longimicrobiales bacterium]